MTNPVLQLYTESASKLDADVHLLGLKEVDVSAVTTQVIILGYFTLTVQSFIF